MKDLVESMGSEGTAKSVERDKDNNDGREERSQIERSRCPSHRRHKPRCPGVPWLYQCDNESGSSFNYQSTRLLIYCYQV